MTYPSGYGYEWRRLWHKRLFALIRERGHSSVSEYIEGNPVASLLDLAEDLGSGNVAAIQLEWLWVAEAEANDRLERCARSLLARGICQKLPEGWHREWPDIPGDPTTPRYRQISAFASMEASIPERYQGAADRVWSALQAADICEGWLPTGGDDPVLVEIFGCHWPDPMAPTPYPSQQGHAWREKWQERLYALIRARGFLSVTDYVASRPGVTLLDLADQLGSGNVAEVQIARQWLAEAQASGAVEKCARGLLARIVRKALPKGWGKGWATERVFAAFTDALRPAYEDAADRVCLALDESADLISEGWIPENEDDPLIVDVFQRWWGAPHRSERT